MLDIKPDEKMPLSWIIAEQTYWVKRFITNTSRTVLYQLMPRWLVREAFMYAQRYIADNEEIPSIEFMTVFKRICDNEVMTGTRVTG
jgi:hypothetical protein